MDFASAPEFKQNGNMCPYFQDGGELVRIGLDLCTHLVASDPIVRIACLDALLVFKHLEQKIAGNSFVCDSIKYLFSSGGEDPNKKGIAKNMAGYAFCYLKISLCSSFSRSVLNF
jgi:hypothetical protein